jgi:hypothetical protein
MDHGRHARRPGDRVHYVAEAARGAVVERAGRTPGVIGHTGACGAVCRNVVAMARRAVLARHEITNEPGTIAEMRPVARSTSQTVSVVYTHCPTAGTVGLTPNVGCTN